MPEHHAEIAVRLTVEQTTALLLAAGSHHAANRLVPVVEQIVREHLCPPAGEDR